MSLWKKLLWCAVTVLGLGAVCVLALSRGEQINAMWIVTAGLCAFAISYRFYSKWLATKVLVLNDERATPAVVQNDGKDFVPTNRWMVFGHHFAAIAGPGPLVGPVLAAQFGFLPGTLWILIGATLGGAVHDMIILFASVRRGGKTLGQIVKEEIGWGVGALARSEEHTSELQSRFDLVCRLLLEKKKKNKMDHSRQRYCFESVRPACPRLKML